MEGIFFGFPGGAAVSFRLLGKAGSGVSGKRISALAEEVIAECADKGLRPLAWASLRRSEASMKCNTFLPHEENLHEAFRNLDLDTFRGCIFRCERGRAEKLSQRAACFSSEKRKVKMYIEPDVSDSKGNILPPEGTLLKKAMSGCEKGIKNAGDALQAALSVATKAISTNHSTAKRFAMAQRAAAGQAAYQRKRPRENSTPVRSLSNAERPKQEEQQKESRTEAGTEARTEAGEPGEGTGTAKAGSTRRTSTAARCESQKS